MFFQQRSAADATLSCFFGCAGIGKAVAVDVIAGDEEWFAEQARQRGVSLASVIDTHVHADHRSGGLALARRVGAPDRLHESNRGRTTYDFFPLTDGQRLQSGNVIVEMLHTPGHTLDSVCLLVHDLRRGEAPWFAVTGDTLLVGAVGRTDLAGREREMAAQLRATLHEKLLRFPPELEIYPGDQAGSACGPGLSGKPTSTIGFERQCNPMLSLQRDAFVDALVADIPPPPAQMNAIVRDNLGQRA